MGSDSEVATTPDAPLPADADEHLASLDADALIELLIADEDRAPRNVIDAAARLGDAMVVALRSRLGGPWDDSDTDTGSMGPWWLRLHAAMILGLLAQESAGLLLVDLMRRMDVAEDEDLQDWLAVEWPALFANKPASVLAALRELCTDPHHDWYIRACGLEAAAALAERQGPSELDAALAWIAAIGADDGEHPDMRLCCGSVLLDFPRAAYRPLVDALAATQTGPMAHFRSGDVTRAYAPGRDDPPWRNNDEPWDFYAPDAIRKRRQRWTEEDVRAERVGTESLLDDDDVHLDEDDDLDMTLPYVRATPKVGRNDPCPCGSGKTYKKCCLPSVERYAGGGARARSRASGFITTWSVV
jgi:hypothetical protein